jgi:hypothetical protein
MRCNKISSFDQLVGARASSVGAQLRPSDVAVFRLSGQMAIGVGRRRFISALGGVSITWPLAVGAQPESIGYDPARD